jgi:hypothetical protein
LKKTIVIFVCLMLVWSTLSILNMTSFSVSAQTSPDVYVGVDLAYYPYNVNVTKAFIDQVSPYTNLIAIGSGSACAADNLGTIFQYAYDKGMSFMSFIPTFRRAPTYGNVSLDTTPWSYSNATKWYEYAIANWSSNLVGFLAPMEDEPGGQMLDLSKDRPVKLANVGSHTDAADQFIQGYSAKLANERSKLNITSYPLFTCDYSLYWFDYKATQDCVFAEFGWNHSRQLNVALNRGAAVAQNKQWGVVITYTYNSTPYLESGPELYQDMVTAYDNGAKYILVFDTNPSYSADILKPEHFAAMQQFWQYALANPRKTNFSWDRTALVLPKGYACGFRWANDAVWGLWQSNSFSFGSSTYNAINNLLVQYGDKLDIIYDDDLLPGQTSGYRNLIYWNDSSLLPTPSPTITDSPSPSPTESPTPQITLDPTTFPSPTIVITDSPPVTRSPTLTPTLSPSSTQQKDSSPTQYVYIAAGVLVAAIFAGFFLFLRGSGETIVKS